MKFIAKVVVLAALLSGLLACAQMRPTNASGYPVFEMRSDMVRPVRPTGDHNIAWLDRWPDGDRRTRIVFIVENIDRQTVEEMIGLLDRVARRTAKARERATPT